MFGKNNKLKHLAFAFLAVCAVGLSSDSYGMNDAKENKESHHARPYRWGTAKYFANPQGQEELAALKKAPVGNAKAVPSPPLSSKERDEKTFLDSYCARSDHGG